MFFKTCSPILLFLLAMFIVACQQESHTPCPIAKNGILDLSGWNFYKDGPVKLDGEWKMKWMDDNPGYVSPGFDDSEWEVKTLPFYWKEHGFVYYRLTVLLPGGTRRAGLYIRSMLSAYELYINGEKVAERGRLGTTKNEEIRQVLPALIPLPPGEIIQCTLKVSNYCDINGGSRRSMIIGVHDRLYHFISTMDMAKGITIGIMIIMGIFHLILWISRRKEVSYLYLGIFCILLAGRVTATSYFIEKIFPIPTMFLVHIPLALQFLSIIYGTFLFTLFTHTFFKADSSVTVIHLIGVLSLCFTIMFPFFEFLILQMSDYFLFLLIFWNLFVMGRALVKKRKGIRILIAGIGILIITLVNDVLFGRFPSVYRTIDLIPFGIIVVIISQSIMLSRKYADAHNRAEHLSVHMKHEVEARTLQLKTQKMELENINTRLADLDTAKNKFLQNITHEFRTPLTLIKGPLALLDTHITNGGKNLITMIQRNADRLLHLINQLLDLSKLESGNVTLQRRSLDCIRFIRRVVSAFDSAAKLKKIDLELILPEGPLITGFDPEKMEKALNNILINAIHYTDEGRIQVTVSFQNSRDLEIRVSDTGQGIPARDLPFVFERFHQADAYKGGTGIGLALAKEYIILHNGMITVKSEIGRGTEFCIYLPIVNTPGDEVHDESFTSLDPAPALLDIRDVRREKENAHLASEAKHKILIVEDNLDMLSYLTEILAIDYSIIQADDGEQGYASAVEYQPDIIVSDIMMPNLDGTGLLKKLRENPVTAHIPFIFITAKASDDCLLDGFSLGAEDYLFKPFHPRILKAKLKNILKRPGKPFPVAPVLIIDQYSDEWNDHEAALINHGINNIIIASSEDKVKLILEKRELSAIILSFSEGNKNVFDLFLFIRQEYTEIPVIVVVEKEDRGNIDLCLDYGAYSFLKKPVNIPQCITTLRRAIELWILNVEKEGLKQQLMTDSLPHPEAFSPIITNNSVMKRLFSYCELIAESPKPILITGENGVGKELFARALHTLSKVKGEFVTVNIAGLDETLFADTLFGHCKGAFTGAVSDRPGLIEKAAGGTLFLDEIGDLEPASQVKLLRLIQESEYYKLGSDVPSYSNARIIAATNIDLKEKIEENSFRKDLYFRLLVHQIHIPPLRKRLEDDLVFLIDHFIQKASRALEKSKPRIPDSLYRILTSYDFPGNVRELESILYNAVSISSGSLLAIDSIREYLKGHSRHTSPICNKGKLVVMTSDGRIPKLSVVKNHLIRQALEKTSGNQSEAAELLGISQSTISKKMKSM